MTELPRSRVMVGIPILLSGLAGLHGALRQLVSAKRTEDLVHVVLDNLRRDLEAPRLPR